MEGSASTVPNDPPPIENNIPYNEATLKEFGMEDYMYFGVFAVFGILLYIVLDRIFFCFRKPPPHAKISIKSLVKPPKPDDLLQPYPSPIDLPLERLGVIREETFDLQYNL
jgi:hypothetical protein